MENLIKDFDQFVNEQNVDGQKAYEYGCAMAYFDSPKIHELQAKIEPADVYHDPKDPSFGIEDEPHVTLLFGIHSNEVKDSVVMDICTRQHIFLLALMNVSTFPIQQGSPYEVLKFDVGNPYLASINAELKKLPHTSTFPDYHPHSTIAYLLPGRGQKYVDLFKGIQINANVNSIVYSKPNGQKVVKKWY